MMSNIFMSLGFMSAHRGHKKEVRDMESVRRPRTSKIMAKSENIFFLAAHVRSEIQICPSPPFLLSFLTR
jgi:hypothetical protein